MNKILFSGGGTLGSVMPLLAVKEKLEDKQCNFFWVGTEDGPEQEIIEENNIKFISVKSGKFRRYLSLENLIAPIRFFWGLVQSIKILQRERPDLCISAGGFVSVPVHLAAWVLGIPSWVHQQDLKVGLANKIMAKFADKVTVSVQPSKASFSRKDIEVIGNPLRASILQGDLDQAREIFDIHSKKPTLLALGGGTGAREVNNLILKNIEQLDNFEIIHVTGPERDDRLAKEKAKKRENYRVYEFLDEEMKHAYEIADLVVCRAGFSTLTELVALDLPAILVPKEGHQEKNASWFCRSDNFLNFKNNNKDFPENIESLKNTNQTNEILEITDKTKIREIVSNLINSN